MERLKVVELKALCKGLGLRGYSRLRKVELIRSIMDHLSSRPRPIPRARRVRPPKPTRPPPPPPPRPVPPPRPPPKPKPIPRPKPPCIVQRYQLRNKESVVGDVQQPEGMDESPKVKYDP